MLVFCLNESGSDTLPEAIISVSLGFNLIILFTIFVLPLLLPILSLFCCTLCMLAGSEIFGLKRSFWIMDEAFVACMNIIFPVKCVHHIQTQYLIFFQSVSLLSLFTHSLLLSTSDRLSCSSVTKVIPFSSCEGVSY